MKQTLQRFTNGDDHGLHYAVSIFFATIVLWLGIHGLAKSNPVWAISSMVATSEPLMKQAINLFRARFINTLVGCAVGLLFIAIGGSKLLTLPIAMAATVLLSSYVVRVPTMWRQAPISAAFVIAAAHEHHSRINALYAGSSRVAEVLFGCVVGLLTGWVVSVVWPLPEVATASASKSK